MRSRFSRKRAANGSLRYLNKREEQEPRTKYDTMGNRTWGRPGGYYEDRSKHND